MYSTVGRMYGCGSKVRHFDRTEAAASVRMKEDRFVMCFLVWFLRMFL